jgi:hypothetical protein
MVREALTALGLAVLFPAFSACSSILVRMRSWSSFFCDRITREVSQMLRG